MTTLIRTHAQLLALTSPRVRRGVRRVELAVPGYAREVRRLQHQINRNLRARGWALACLFTFAGLLAFAALLWLQPAALDPPLARAAAGFAVLLLAATGKQIGLLLADRRLCAAIASYRS
jgi:hypothetical protein